MCWSEQHLSIVRQWESSWGRKAKTFSIIFSFPSQWQLQTYWTLNPPLTTLSPASPSPQSQSHWLLERKVRWEEKSKPRPPKWFLKNASRVLLDMLVDTSPYVFALIEQLKCCRWLPRWWSGRQWQPSFFWWFCTWWWELQYSDLWSSLMRGRLLKSTCLYAFTF